MKNIYKAARALHRRFFPEAHKDGRNWKMFSQKEYTNALVTSYLLQDQACMVARFGSTELATLINYIGTKQNNRSLKDFITGKSLKWWWDPAMLNQLQQWSGFFPPTEAKVEAFCNLMLNDIEQLDLLGSWLQEERYLAQGLEGVKQVILEDLEPFFTPNPWTHALAGKKVLVVHPFTETIEKQYQKKDLIFPEGLLPDFELKTVKAVQSVAGAKTDYADWFEALDAMKQQIDATDYEVAIIGCGAYGFPLAAHVKRSGKKAIHLAGATQLLFGIKGKRWENYIVWPYMNLFNEHWVRPGENEKPKNAQIVEGACYW